MFNTSVQNTLPITGLLLLAAIHLQCQPTQKEDPVKSLLKPQTAYTTYQGQVGGRKKLMLADSSMVILNAGSRLLVPATFPQKSREIVLDGEAFFEAAPNAHGQPFIVKTDKLTITALGTTFRIRSFTSQPGATAYLLKGKVRVAKTYHSDTDNQPEILERGQMVLANKDIDLMEKETYQPAELESWLRGDLRFKNVPFMTMVRQLEDWYAVTITVEGNVSSVENITASFQNNTLQQTLDILQKVAHFSYEIKGNEVTINVR
jgi:ferric-dicitrate binding protein FerR (iron transport regulator)